MTLTTLHSTQPLRTELSRILELLRVQLIRQRDRGRTPAVDTVQGYVIEEGEAEGLATELAQDLSRPCFGSASPRPTWTPLEPQSASASTRNSGCSLGQVIKSFELCQAEYDAMLLALAVEVDARFGRLVAFLNDHVGRTRPTLGMVLQIAAEQLGTSALFPPELFERPAIRDGLLIVEGEGPLPGMTLRVPREMILRLVSYDLLQSQVPFVDYANHRCGILAGLVLTDAIRARATTCSNYLRHSAFSSPLIIAGASGSGRRTLAEAIATEAAWSLTTVEFEAEHISERLCIARREARWNQSALLLKLKENIAPSSINWSVFWDELQTLQRPLFLALPSAAVDAASANSKNEPAIISILQPDLSQRVQLWKALLPAEHKTCAKTCETLAARFRFGPGQISRAIRRAISQTTLSSNSNNPLNEGVLEQACRDLGGASMSALAQKLPLPFVRSDLVVSSQLETEFELAVSWIRHQKQVFNEWGFARRIPYGRGLTALFAGPPGTGKTMAAQVLARELGVDLFRVDFSRLMSKWIGETEKNLAQLFDEAHSAGVALLFDEGDAVAGKRSEVKDAHDRYANLEISYLLQRMEEHEGISIFATNRLGDLDEAFTRRFHFVLDFPKPDADQRLRIWKGIFPASANCDEDLDLKSCAHEFKLSGGEIKNAALAAAFLAAQQNSAIKSSHIKTAVHREFLKSGRLADM